MRSRIVTRLPYFIESDGKQAEWVVVAFEANEPRMIEVIREGRDPHTMTAAFMWGIEPEVILAENKALGKLTSSEELVKARAELAKIYPALASSSLPRSTTLRQGGKKDNHAGNYREGPYRYAEINGVSIHEAKLRLHRYSHVVYPGLQLWWANIETFVSRHHYMLCPLGCKIPIMGPVHGKKAIDTFKQATAAVPQHTVHHIVMHAQPAILELAPDILLVCDNHDSNLTQHWIDPREGLEAAAARILREARQISDLMTLEIPSKAGPYTIGIEAKAGMNWGEVGPDNLWGLTDLPLTEDGALAVAQHFFNYMEAKL